MLINQVGKLGGENTLKDQSEKCNKYPTKLKPLLRNKENF